MATQGHRVVVKRIMGRPCGHFRVWIAVVGDDGTVVANDQLDTHFWASDLDSCDMTEAELADFHRHPHDGVTEAEKG